MSGYRRVYLDHNATTPVHPEVLEAMLQYYKDDFGNPSSVHLFGRSIKAKVNEAREVVARAINADPAEIYFTSGGTESDNLAIKGYAWAHAKTGGRVITSAIEHPAVLEVVKYLSKNGFHATYVPVDAQAMVDPEAVRQAMTPDTLLVSIMYANNEVGTIQPIKEITQTVKERGAAMHTDGVQAFGKIPVDVKDLGVDMMSLSGHKMNGPKGVGALYVRKGVKLHALSHGGHHERSLRAGTENVAGIIGFAKAVELRMKTMDEEMARLRALRDELQRRVLEAIPYTHLNGHPDKRTPNTVNISFECVEGEALLINLDMAGIAISTGSACSSGSLDPSHVLMAMGIPHEVIHGSLRFSFGMGNTKDDVDYVMAHLPRIIDTLRDISPLWDSQNGKVISVDEAAEGATFAGH